MPIVRKLHLNDTDVPTFTDVGAFGIFAQKGVKSPLPQSVPVGEEFYYIWRTQDEIAIAATKENPSGSGKFVASKMQWSYFHMSGEHWEDYWMNYLSLGQVFDLILLSPQFRDEILKIRP